MARQPQITPVSPIPEIYLHYTWQNPVWFRADLHTVGGRPLKILFPGRPNPDNGPDFLNARLQIGSEIQVGDVEVHLYPADWFRHGHHRDSRYRRVILHVVWEASPEVPSALAAQFPHFEIAGALKFSRSRWLQKVRAVYQGNPNRPVLPPAPLKLSEIEHYARLRFQRHLSELQRQVNHLGWDGTLWQGLAGIMGYRQNRDNLQLLFHHWPPSRLYRRFHPLEISPVLFWLFWVWQAGLLGPRRPSEALSRLIPHFPPPLMTAGQWYTSRLRPANLPWVRLAGLAQLAAVYPPGALFRKIESVLAGRPAPQKVLNQAMPLFVLPLAENLKKQLQNLFPGSYLPARVMGEQRLSQLMVNVVLPLLSHYAACRGSWGYRAYLEEVYYTLPAIESVVWLKELLANWRLPRRAAIEQGVLEFVAINQLQAA